jgi:hypothetical protein
MSAVGTKGCALITGASSGIGAVYADRLSKRGLSGTGSTPRAAPCPPGFRVRSRPLDTTSDSCDLPGHEMTSALSKRPSADSHEGASPKRCTHSGR